MTAILQDARTRWLAARKELVTASDAAAILGLDPRRSPMNVYAEKLGLVEVEESPYMRRGRRCEPVIAAEYQDATGRPALDVPSYELVRHPDAPWLAATPDRMTHDAPTATTPAPAPGQGPLELKLVGRQYAAEWDDDAAPVYYEVQLAIQMACTGAQWGSLCGLLGLDAAGPAVRDRVRNDRFLRAAMPRLERFLWRVRRREAPPVQRLPGEPAAVRALYPLDNGNTVDIGPDALDLVDRWESARARAAAAYDEAEYLETVLRARMADASFAALPDGSYLRLTKTERDGYTAVVRPTTYRSLRRTWPRLKRR